MTASRVLRVWWERETLRPDLARGIRCMLSFMAPVLLFVVGHLRVEMVFCAVAAQSIANVDLRGPYGLRFSLLLAKSLIIASAAGLGALTGHPLALTLAATALIAAAAGLWRHLSTDYGASLAVASALVFYIAADQTGGPHLAWQHFAAAFAGGLWGVLLQVCFWPFKPQHPLRVAVSDSWLSAAELFGAIAARPNDSNMPAGVPASALQNLLTATSGALANPTSAHLSTVGNAEASLRQQLDKGYAVVDAAGTAPIALRLKELNRVAARLALRVSAYHEAREAFHAGAGELLGDWTEAEAPLLTVLQNLARTVAIAVVSRSPAHLAAANVRVRRASHLAQVLREKAEAMDGGAPLAEAVGEIERYLPDVAAALSATVDRAGERSAFSLELFELSGAALRPLALSLNYKGHWDRALLRFVARIGTLTLIGVAVMKLTRLPHGYWLPFTMVIVLQPDYGSTRQRAAQRLLGTLGGSIAGSVLLYLRLPFVVLIGCVALCCLVFGYFLKRNYALAVVFITVFVVSLTEAFAPQTLALTGERLGITLAGGLLALMAAFLFWPVWERDRVRPILARGLRANSDLLRLSFPADGMRPPIEAPAIVAARRRAESANAEVFASLQRMAGDPRDRQDRLEKLAAFANGNQRLTRAIGLALLQASAQSPAPGAVKPFAEGACAALEALASGLEAGAFPADVAAHRSSLTTHTPAALARAAAELSALLLEAQELALG